MLVKAAADMDCTTVSEKMIPLLIKVSNIYWMEINGRKEKVIHWVHGYPAEHSGVYKGDNSVLF